MMLVDLTVIWAAIIAFAIIAYVIMDGFDLGIGMLFPRIPVGKQRDTAMNSIAPIWDGNETWLVLGGGGLLAAFPLAYAVILPALYAPLTAMLLGLILRGVAFEYRWRDEQHREIWDRAFFAGSFIATFSQGVTLGALLQGISVTGRAYSGGWWEWLSPFSLLTGVGLCTGYVLLGSCWLILKTGGALQNRAYVYARAATLSLVLAIASVSAATPFLDEKYYQRWLEYPNIVATAPIPIVTALITLLLLRSLTKRAEIAPFLHSLTLFGLCTIGLGISIWPDIIPGRITIWAAAAPERSQLFMLVGASVLVPIILAYTAYAYWVFRGKVDSEGYH